MFKIDIKFHCIHPSRSGFKGTPVFCLLLACFSVMLAQPGFEQTAIAETYGFTEDATLNDYDPVPSGTAYGPSPGFYFTNFYFLSGASGETLNGSDDFYTDERAAGSDQAWFVTSDGSEVNIIRMDIAAWAIDGFLNPDDNIFIEGLRNGSQIYSTNYTFAARNIMYTVTLNWNNIDQIRFTGVDPSALAELQVEMDNLVFETPPFVQSINRADPNPTNASSVDYTVTFSEGVTGVDATDFSLATSGISGASVTSVVPGSGSTRTVTVNTGSGDGTLRLDLVDDDTIQDGDGNPLGGTGSGNGNFTGQTYTIDNTPPTVSIDPPSVVFTDTGPVDYIVTYTGADTVNLTSGDVTLNKTGTADGTVSVANGTTVTPTVTISSITGDGTLGISIAPGTSSDTAGNTDAGAGPSATFIADNTPPPPPSTPDLLASSDTGSSDTDDITSDTTPDFTGTAEANSTVELSSDINGSVGTGPADGAGNWTITASTLSEGTHNITATATDAVGKTSLPSPALSVIITLNPVARDDQYTTDENTTLNVPAPGVLGNDVDVHGNALTVQSVDTTGTIGLVSMNPDGSFTYTPAGGFAGYDSFTYVVMEDGDGTDTGTVSITVNCKSQRSIRIRALDFALDGTTLSGSFSLKNDSKRSHDAQVIGTQIGLECRLKKEKKEVEWMEIETENHVFTPAPPVVFSDDLIIAFTCDLMEAIPDGAKSLRLTSTVEVFGAEKSFVSRSSQEPPSSGASFFAPARLSAVPEKTSLGQNFRNPFNPDTWIPYQLARDVNVTIRIYSIPGRLIRTLDLGRKAAGFYTTKDRAAYWDGRNESGESVSSGIYFYQIQAGEFSAMRKMTILK